MLDCACIPSRNLSLRRQIVGRKEVPYPPSSFVFLFLHAVPRVTSMFCRRHRYGFAEIKMGVGLNTLAVEGSYEKGFLSIFEEKFTADVRLSLRAKRTKSHSLAA